MENSFKNEIKKKELNSFIIALFIIGSLYGFNKSLANVIELYRLLHEGVRYISYIPIIGTSINVFIALYFIVYKKSIVGVWFFFSLQIIYAMLFTFISPVNNYAHPYIWGLSFSKIIFVSLILLLRKNGETAWKTLSGNNKNSVRINNKIVESNEFNNKETKSTAQIITYILTGIVIMLMIVAIIVSI